MRHSLTPMEPDKYICFVGYDRNHRTFYVYVANKGAKDRAGKLADGESNHAVLWVGSAEGSIYHGEFCAAPHMIRSVDEVKELLDEFAELPDYVERSLRSCVADEKGVEALK